MTHATNVERQRHIEVLSDEGCSLNICNIISTHFRLQPIDDIHSEQQICCSCWGALNDFHQFYKRIIETNQQLGIQTSSVVANVAHDALSPQTELKSEAAYNSGKLADELCLEEHYFDTEVKLEVQDLDLLPQIEIVEAFPIQNERAQRASRRHRQAAKDDIKQPTTSTNKILALENPLSSTTDCIKSDADEHDQLSTEAVLSLEATSNGETKKRRRGRPKKVKVEDNPPTMLAHRNDDETEIEATPPVEATEPSIASDADNDNNAFAPAMDGCTGTEESAASSDDSTDEDGKHSDYEPKKKYAVIPKRKVVKPKKYRKREKPLVPPKRMTREEIDKRNVQKEEYDKVIKDFFGGFSCPKCNVLVKNFGEISAHFRVSHGDEIGYMACCSRKFPQRKALAEHVYIHLNPEHFKCAQCGKVMQDSRNLEAHEETHKNPSEQREKKTFACVICDKTYTTKAAYEDHRFAKHVPQSEFNIPCPHCDKKLPTKRRLSGHIKYMHDPESVAICDKCGKKVRNQSCLRKHHQLQHPEEPLPPPVPVQCEICGTWYRHAKGLRQHMRSIHEDTGREHRCHICNKVSVTANALKHHIYLNHRCERKFKCTMCEKAFKRLQDLREHTSTHTGKVLYTCPNCPMTFFSNANMYKHRQRLHRAQWEADRKKPIPPNIMQKAVGVAARMNVPQTDKKTLDLFVQRLGSNVFTTDQPSSQVNQDMNLN